VSVAFALAGDGNTEVQQQPLTPTQNESKTAPKASGGSNFGFGIGINNKGASVSFADETSMGGMSSPTSGGGGGGVQSDYRSMIQGQDSEAKSEKIFKILQHKDKLIEKLTGDLTTATSNTDQLKAAHDKTHLELTNMSVSLFLFLFHPPPPPPNISLS
jgi:hypothetical protein